MQLKKKVGVFVPYLLKREDTVGRWQWMGSLERFGGYLPDSRKKNCAPHRARTSANRCRCSAGFSASLRANMHLFDRQLIPGPGLLASSAPTTLQQSVRSPGGKSAIWLVPTVSLRKYFDCQFNYFLRRNRCICNPRLRSNLANTCRRCLLPN